MLALALALTCQWLEPTPDRVHDGEVVRVVVRDARGVGVGGLEIHGGPSVRDDSVLGVTGLDGALEFRPASAGTWRLWARLGELSLSAPLTVFDSTSRSRRRVGSLVGAALIAILSLSGIRRRARARRVA